jgi:zinc protease
MTHATASGGADSRGDMRLQRVWYYSGLLRLYGGMMAEGIGRGLRRLLAGLAATACLCGLGTAGKQLGTGSAARTGSAKTEKLPNIAFEKYKLKNGLDVILSEDHTLPLVSVNIWYHVGPAYEVPGRTGFAHLFEHMMFQGSEHVGPKAHFRYLEQAGATGINGTTSFDRTNYFETVPSNQLELALWLESDRMGYLLPTLDQEKLANQRDVVRNERRQSTESAPYGIVQEELFHELFPKGHPYYGVVIGSHADIEAARLNDVRAFFKQYYTPNNASLSIAGDFDPKTIKGQVEKYFGTLPEGPAVPKPEVKTPPITAERRRVVTDTVELPRVYMVWFGPSFLTQGDAENDLVTQILGGGKTSRLYQSLVHDKQIAQDVSAFNQSMMLTSVVEIQATARPGVKPEDLEKAIDNALVEFRAKGPTQAEVEQARNGVEGQMISQLQSTSRVADLLNQYNHYLHDPGFLQKDFERYEKITAADLKKRADEGLATNERVVVYGVPGKKVLNDVPKTPPAQEAKEAPVTGGAPEEAWRAKAPAPGPAPKLVLPVATVFKLGNGLTVYLVERHKLPLMSAALEITGGNTVNPTDKPGLASFTADMLTEGTTKMNSLEFSSAVEQLGANVTTAAGDDSSGVALDALTKNEDAAFSLFADAALRPAFSADEVDRVRTSRITSLLQQKDSPRAIAFKAVGRVLYGNGPYGQIALGTEASNRAISRKDLVALWKKTFVPSAAALVLAGDLTEGQARSLAEKYFGEWNGERFAAEAPAAPAAPSKAIYVSDRPGSPQTMLLAVGEGATRATPDYVPLTMMNAVLGGLFSSRLNMNLREKHGYTYGARSIFDFRRGTGYFWAGASVRTDATGPATQEIFSELQRMRDTEVSAEELKLAKDYYSQSLVGRFQTTDQLAATFGDLHVFGLPADYYEKLPPQIDAVTTADVHRVAQKYIDPEHMFVVAVGDRAKIEPELQKDNVGTVQAAPQ